MSTEELSQKKDTGNLEEDTKEFKSPLLIYNRDRTICFFMSKDCPIYKNIIKEIIKNGVGGAKGYFNSIKEGDSIKINCKRIQIPQKW